MSRMAKGCKEETSYYEKKNSDPFGDPDNRRRQQRESAGKQECLDSRKSAEMLYM